MELISKIPLNILIKTLIISRLESSVFSPHSCSVWLSSSTQARASRSFARRWISLPEATRISIKQHVMGTLGTEPYHPSIAAQCVKAIACAELPTGLWPDVISLLMGNVTSPQSGEMLKQSSLEALGYICQEIDANVGLETTALQAYSLETS
ncbi:hypothetical protein WR25_19860 [Diploscapter pachys]|uniref:Importin N-terminal domain-containing protein n=1 Tax=Diploscapter pachys TaxID=2018661 RepID=A0A2A2KL14_9BILA|nr:hypothetical protein WR25_19860 [Diploscapter pachys]